MRAYTTQLAVFIEGKMSEKRDSIISPPNRTLPGRVEAAIEGSASELRKEFVVNGSSCFSTQQFWRKDRKTRKRKRGSFTWKHSSNLDHDNDKQF